MQLGYVIIYVRDVLKSVDFYQHAFDLRIKSISENKLYAELIGQRSSWYDAENAILSFVDEKAILGETPNFHSNRSDASPAGIKLTFVAGNVCDAFKKAVQAGATPVSEPQLKPWGRTTAQLKDLNGILVEICDPEVKPSLFIKADD